MIKRRISSLRDTVRSLVAFARVTSLFRMRDAQVINAVVREATLIQPTDQRRLRESNVDIWRTARAVWRARRVWPLRSRCLETSLVMQRVFASHGLDAAVRIGVQKSDDVFAAHAWCELGDYVLDPDRAASMFAAFEFVPEEKAS